MSISHLRTNQERSKICQVSTERVLKLGCTPWCDTPLAAINTCVNFFVWKLGTFQVPGSVDDLLRLSVCRGWGRFSKLPPPPPQPRSAVICKIVLLKVDNKIIAPSSVGLLECSFCVCLLPTHLIHLIYLIHLMHLNHLIHLIHLMHLIYLIHLTHLMYLVHIGCSPISAETKSPRPCHSSWAPAGGTEFPHMHTTIKKQV